MPYLTESVGLGLPRVNKKMSPLLWNIALVWSASAVLAVEYCAALMERDDQRQPQQIKSQIRKDDGNGD